MGTFSPLSLAATGRSGRARPSAPINRRRPRVSTFSETIAHRPTIPPISLSHTRILFLSLSRSLPSAITYPVVGGKSRKTPTQERAEGASGRLAILGDFTLVCRVTKRNPLDTPQGESRENRRSRWLPSLRLLALSLTLFPCSCLYLSLSSSYGLTAIALTHFLLYLFPTVTLSHFDSALTYGQIGLGAS